MRPLPLAEDVPVRTTPYYDTAAWLEASHRNGFPYAHDTLQAEACNVLIPYAHDSFYNTVTPAPRFNPTINPIGKTFSSSALRRNKTITRLG